MKQVRKIKFGSGVQQIKIYKITADKTALVDIEYTNINGVLRWMPPSMGVYNLICDIAPEYSVTGYSVVNDAGFAEYFNYPTT